MEDINDRDPGDVFAIPDLYGPSICLSDPSQNLSFLFAGLKFDGLWLLLAKSPMD
jgi:hypothetical protein